MQHNRRFAIVAGGLSLNYARIGAGHPVVFIHGALTTLDDGLIALAEALAPGHELIAFDRPGHGDSQADGGSGSAWRQARLIHEAVQALGLDRPTLVGHSFGGSVATAYAMLFPDDISGCVAIAPIAFPEPRLEQMMFGSRAVPGVGELTNAMAAPVDALILPLLWHAMFLPQAMPTGFAAEFPFAQAGRRSQLRADGQDALNMAVDLTRSALSYAGARVPLKVLQGDRDAVVNPLVHGRRLAALWPGGEFINLPGLGHMAHHFAQDAVVDAIAAVGGAAPSTSRRTSPSRKLAVA